MDKFLKHLKKFLLHSKDAKLVLSVLKDDKDKSMLRFVDVGPIYVSPDCESGIDDAIKFFPHDFDEMDGEIKMWLAQNLAQDEEAAVDEEVGLQGNGKEECLVEEHPVAAEEPLASTVADIGWRAWRVHGYGNSRGRIRITIRLEVLPEIPLGPKIVIYKSKKMFKISDNDVYKLNFRKISIFMQSVCTGGEGREGDWLWK